MREKGENWQKQLDSVLIEVRGLHKMFGDQLEFLIILTKLEGLDEVDNFMTYRSTVLSIISAMTEMINLLDVRES